VSSVTRRLHLHEIMLPTSSAAGQATTYDVVDAMLMSLCRQPLRWYSGSIGFVSVRGKIVMLTRGARSTWSVLVWLVLCMLPIQFFLAGYGAFAFKHGTTNAHDSDWNAHMAFGSIIGLVVILVLIAGLLGRLPRRLTGMTVGLFVLMIVQIVLAEVGDSVSWIGALHPVNALLITGLTMGLAIRAREYLPFGWSKAASAGDGAAAAFANR
jgi:Family of unknown function (DUF6220)